MGLKDWINGRFPSDGSLSGAFWGGGLRKFTNNVRDSATTFTFGRAISGENVDEKSAMQIVTVYACVRLLAESMAQLPLHLYKLMDDGDSSEKAKDHPLYKILYRQPNPEMTKFSFIEVMMTHLLLWGNAYAFIERTGKNEVLSLYPLLPELMDVDRVNNDLVYTYHAYTDERPGETGKDLYFRRDQILHIPGMGFNGLVGFSPIAMQKNGLGGAIAVDRYGNEFFKNGGRPRGVLTMPGTLRDPEKLRQSWERAYGSNATMYQTAILEEGMTYQPISLPPEDSQFLTTKKFNVEEICRIFRVPPHLVQYLDKASYASIEEQGIDFATYTLGPWVERFEEGITKDVLLEDERDIYFPKFNMDGLQRGNYQGRMNAYATGRSGGWFSANDIRRLENMNPIPEEEGGDLVLINGSYVPLKDAGVAYGQNAQAQREEKAAEGGEDDPPGQEEEQEEAENKSRGYYQRKARRKAQRKGGTTDE